MKRALALILLLSISVYCQAQLNKKEKKITSNVDKNNPAAVQMLKDVININSGSMNFDGVKKVAEAFIPEFQKLGFDASFVEGSSWNRSGHLVAVHEGDPKSPRMLLIGHLDTVFELESPFQEYEMQNDSILHGPGVVDMKGGDVIVLYAMKALKEAGLLDRMNIEVVFTGDEEKSGSPIELSKKNIVEAAMRADIAIGFENGDSDPHTAVVSRRGSMSWQLNVTGLPAHSSQIFSEKIGSGAIYEASRILYQFHEELSSEQYLTFNPGVILGGTQVEYNSSDDGGSAFGKTNVVSKDVIVHGDLRAVSSEQLKRAKETMLRIVDESLPNTRAKIQFSDSAYPPLSPSDANNQLLEIYSNASKDLGFGTVGPVLPINAGAADISFTEGHVKMAMDGLGLSGGKDHTVDEYGNLNWLPRLTKRAAVFIYRLSQMEDL